MSYKAKYLLLLALLVIAMSLCVGGCQRFSDRVSKEKDGKFYGVTRGLFQHRWWHYYERALSFADGGFWKDAQLDLLEAIKQRSKDQRNARTYGRHFIDYFPHRELGVILYEQRHIEDSIRELETSLDMTKSSKAELYLDIVRRESGTKLDRYPPEIIVESPSQPFWTNESFVIIRGIARDDSFVHSLEINGEEVSIGASKKEILFQKEVSVIGGENVISIKVADLTGKISRIVLSIKVDITAPSIGINIEDWNSETGHAYIKGYISDYKGSGIAELVINGRKISCNGKKMIQISESIVLHPSENNIVVKAVDMVGNVNIVKIPISYNIGATTHPNLLAENDFSSMIVAPTKAKMTFRHNLPRENFIFKRIAFPDMTKQSEVASSSFNQASKSSPSIRLIDMIEGQVVYFDRATISGAIESERGLSHLFINGELILEAPIPTRTSHFTHIVNLSVGENIITIRAVDFSGYADVKTIQIKRVTPSPQRSESRLQVAVNRFGRRVIDENKNLSFGFENFLISAMIKSGRFSVKEIGLSQNVDDTDALKEARKYGIDCLLIGHIFERKNAVEIIAQLVDTETSEILVSVDMYSESVDYSRLKLLASKIDIKLTNALPIVDGKVLQVNKNGSIIVDFGIDKGVKVGSKLIIYQIEEPYSEKELPQARINRVKKTTSLAILEKTADKRRVKPNYHVITR